MDLMIIKVSPDEFNARQILLPHALPFTKEEAVVFVVTSTNEFGGLTYEDAYIITKLKVTDGTTPGGPAQVLEAQEYGKITLDEAWKIPLLHKVFIVAPVHEHDQSIYSKTEFI
ncbi:hypothetical protein fHeYen902_153 [Yersinia phage fHe-Yen9-02]|nr:hypothetical protein fHeYen902_153 [Yersinia phage fHe-Yen9-02]